MLPKIPPHHAAIPLADSAQALAICAIVDEKTGAPLVLRELIDGRVLVGCLLDAGGRVHRYLEIWVQQASSLLRASHLSADAMNNARLDEKWRALAQSWAALGDDDVIVTGWEPGLDHIIQLDAKKKTAGDLCSPAGRPLQLCRDEAALKSAQLPSYASTLHRYLTDGEKFFALSTDAPTPGDVALLPPPVAGTPILNPQGGPILVRTLHPFALATYCDFLGGAPAELSIGSIKAQPWLSAIAPPDALDSTWVLGSHGRSGRVIEVLYLKLTLLLEAFTAVLDSIEQTRLPLLNLTSESFRVKLAPAGSALPLRWSARAMLWSASEAMPLSIPGAGRGSFIAAKPHGESAYRAPAMRSGASGAGTLRIRRINAGKSGHFTLEGTLIAQSLAAPSKTDLIWLRAPIDGRTLDVWGTAEVSGTTGAGELRFRSFEQPATPEEIESLSRSDGLSIPDVKYSVTSALSSPCDLHALAVLSTRVLLVNGDRPLAVAVDELMSLAKGALSDDPEKSPQMIQRLTTMLRDDETTQQQLGAQNVMYDPKSAAPSAGAIPPPLWAQIVAFIVRCFPGAAPDSFASDSGDAPPDAIHRVFDPAIEELSSLVESARNLIFADWFSSREISEVIEKRFGDARKLLEGAGGSKSSPPAAPPAATAPIPLNPTAPAPPAPARPVRPTSPAR